MPLYGFYSVKAKGISAWWRNTDGNDVLVNHVSEDITAAQFDWDDVQYCGELMRSVDSSEMRMFHSANMDSVDGI